MNLINVMIGLAAAFCTGGTGVAVVNALTGRSGRRAKEASSVADVAEAVNKMNFELRAEIRLLKTAVIELTDTIDELLPDMSLASEQKARLRLVNNKAKLAA